MLLFAFFVSLFQVWSLYHKKFKKEMLFNNPAHQPANIGLRKAWTSGGCEWNWSPGIIGHGVFTESQVYMAQIHTDLGPILRVYEFDRLNHTVWQVDMLFDDRDGTFWAHPKVTNTNPHDILGYWWTCAAHPITDQSRVVTPATYTVENSHGMDRADWPKFAYNFANASFYSPGIDMSYLRNVPDGMDAFVRIMKPQLPYIAHADGEGFTVVHGHQLNGTKFFTWGKSPKGQFWMDFLSASAGQGDYTELQIGPAPTQMQNFPVEANDAYQWTEWFKPFVGNVSQLHSDNYRESLVAVSQWIDSNDGLAESRIKEMQDFLAKYADHPITKENLITTGSSWGALHEKSTGKELSASTYFTMDMKDTQAMPWSELLESGQFSNTSLNSIPTSFQVTDDWVKQLDSALSKHGSNWLIHLHLGVAAAEQGNGDLARSHFNMSANLKPNAHAYRNLAVTAGTSEEVYSYYMKAWGVATGSEFHGDPNADRLINDLAAEICLYLQSANSLSQLSDFVDKLPGSATTRDQVISAKASIALYHKDYASVYKILTSNCFPTYGSDRSKLIDIWFNAHYEEEEQTLKRSLTILEAHQVRMKYPVPGNIGVPY